MDLSACAVTEPRRAVFADAVDAHDGGILVTGHVVGARRVGEVMFDGRELDLVGVDPDLAQHLENVLHVSPVAAGAPEERHRRTGPRAEVAPPPKPTGRPPKAQP